MYFTDFLSSTYEYIPSSYFMASGQDLNVYIGSNKRKNNYNISKYDLKNRRFKGVEASTF